MTDVRFPAEEEDFSSSLCIQISSEAHPASCPKDTGGPFPGVKRGRGVCLRRGEKKLDEREAEFRIHHRNH
jgi:hypothetical protein